MFVILVQIWSYPNFHLSFNVDFVHNLEYEMFGLLLLCIVETITPEREGEKKSSPCSVQSKRNCRLAAKPRVYF